MTSAISLAVSRGHLAIHCHGLEKLLLLTKKANKLNLNLKGGNVPGGGGGQCSAIFVGNLKPDLHVNVASYMCRIELPN